MALLRTRVLQAPFFKTALQRTVIYSQQRVVPNYALIIRGFGVSPSLTMPLAERDDGVKDLDGVVPLASAVAAGTSPIDWRLPHSTYSREEMEAQKSGHHVPRGFVEWAAMLTVRTLRTTFDVITGYAFGIQHEKAMLTRVTFLETVAGVPGMVGAMNRHLKSLRRIERDFGWIHTLLEEAENERMHLMTALILKKPSIRLRFGIIGTQAFFFLFYSTMYSLSPRYCHRFVGYLEEEAFITYTNILNKIDKGKLPGFKEPAPLGAIRYWMLPEDATLRDVFLAMRADENHHRIVNHTFAEMKADHCNPFPPGY